MHGHCYRRRGACARKLQNLDQVSFSPGIPNVGSKGESNLKGVIQHHVNQIPQQQLNIYWRIWQFMQFFVNEKKNISLLRSCSQTHCYQKDACQT